MKYLNFTKLMLIMALISFYFGSASAQLERSVKPNLPPQSHAVDVYLSENGDDANDGSTLADAVASLQRAFDLVGTSTLIGTIYVEGTVLVSTTSPTPTPATGVAFNPANTANLTVEGIAGTSPKLLGDGTCRMFNLRSNNLLNLKNLTLSGAGVDYGGAGACVFLAAGAVSGENVIFENFRATSGSNHGACIMVDGGLSPTRPWISFKNCVFRGCYSPAGAAIRVYQFGNVENAQVWIENCAFTGNTATTNNGGAAIFIRHANTPVIHPVITVINSTVTGNTHTVNGDPGVITMYSADVTLNMVNSTVKDNLGNAKGVAVLNGAKGNIYNSVLEGNIQRDLIIVGATSSVNVYNSLINNIYGTPANGYTKPSGYTLNTLFEDFDPVTSSFTPKEGSLAINFGDATYLDDLGIFNDQLNHLRYFNDGKCDAGAVETKKYDNSKSVIGKIIAGYQGWFNTPGDGSTNSWVHWASGTPKANNLTFEIYPYISEYDDSALAQTGFADFGDGRAAKLFSSYHENVIEKHAEWMKEYEIDGAAIQRFMTDDPRLKRHRDSVAVRMVRAAEKYDRIAYIMYDMSPTDVDAFKKDWLHLVNDLKVTQFSSYAHHNGKPVVCLWGFGFNSRSNLPTNSMTIIKWLKEEQGCYVIGGVARGWRTNSGDSRSGYDAVYRAFDMISPWAVGAFSSYPTSINNHIATLTADKAECDVLGIDYQPVAYPGFAWSQLKSSSSAVPNEQPRRAGEFFWKQISNIYNLNIPNMYLAMFDEYDEGTAFMKNATDWSEIPTDQYFLTASADGYWLSSDFQLRVARAASRVMKGTETLAPNVPVPHSLGPIFYRNSFEKRLANYGTSSSGYFNVDPCFLNAAQISASGVSGMAVTNEQNTQAKSGQYIAKITGTAAGAASYYYKFGEAKIEITEGMTLRFYKYAVNELGLNTVVSLLFNDGTYLHATSLTDEDGIGVNPTNARGQVGAWTKHDVVVGQGELIGKTITALIIGYEGTETGNFEAYFDNIVIWDGSVIDDQDGDGVPDDMDLCPNTPAGEEVDEHGCSASQRDSDGDGVPDDMDLCPNTPAGEEVDENGCSASQVNGVPEIKLASVYFYPTLVQDGYITFNTMQTKDNGQLTVSFVNMQGKVVQQGTIRPKTIETLRLNLPQGFYILSVTGSETNVMSKVIIK